jgi:hypothetical protein
MQGDMDEKFGPAPERRVGRVLAGHFIACMLILHAVRPPFVADGRGARHLLIVLIAATLTYITSIRSTPLPSFC